MLPRIAICNRQENGDPAWSGESLEENIRNESMYPPSILQDLIEHLWKSWRNGNIASDLVNAELQAVITWVNHITDVQLQAEFWSAYF